MNRALAEALLLGRPGPPWRLHVLARTDSTNARLLEAAGGGGEWDHPWTALCAGAQSAGRGRAERRWDCPPGEGLLLSLRLDLDLSRHALGLLGHWAALVLAEVLQRRLDRAGLAARVLWKWPNDLLLEDGAGAGKVAGILAQARTQGERAVAVVGLGVNLGQRAFPPDLRMPARSLAQCGLAAGAEELLADLLAGLGSRGLPEPGHGLLAELAGVDLLATRPARLSTSAGEVDLAAHEHLDDGRLRLAWAGGGTLLAAGGLRLRAMSGEALWLSLER